MQEPTVRFSVRDAQTQTITIRVRVTSFENYEGGPPSEDDVIEVPDPVDAFVAAAQAHMLGASSVEPWTSTATLISRQTHAKQPELSYQLRVQNLAPGAFRVLVNLLLARVPVSVEIETQSTEGLAGAADLDLAALAYPKAHEPLPFAVQYEAPSHSSSGRFVHMQLADTPPADVLEEIYAGFDTWSRLLIFGGYAADDSKAWRSSCDPDPAFLLDPHTVERGFPNAFLCDDDAYAAVVNWAHCLHRAGHPIAGLLFH